MFAETHAHPQIELLATPTAAAGSSPTSGFARVKVLVPKVSLWAS